MPREVIYLDHHSTTPCDPRVLERMLPYFGEKFGNPSAITHLHGREAATAVEHARIAIADVIGVRPNEVYFTAGATESNNIAIRGLAFTRGRHVVASAIEHSSVLAPLRTLEKQGVEVTLLDVDQSGFIAPDALRQALREDTSLVTIMAANGEIGSIQPIAELAEICRDAGVPFHTDATQAIGKIPLGLGEAPCELLSMSGHKFYGPKGIGALVVRKSTRLEPSIVGGGQEKGLRSGTVNVPGVVGLAAALDLRRDEMEPEAARLSRLRDRLRERLISEIEGATVNGPIDNRLPGNLNVSFDGLEAEAIMMAMRNFSLSSGSACSSGSREPSHVLMAIGAGEKRAISSIRFGLGKSNTDEQIDLLVEDLNTTIEKLRRITVM